MFVARLPMFDLTSFVPALISVVLDRFKSSGLCGETKKQAYYILLFLEFKMVSETFF